MSKIRQEQERIRAGLVAKAQVAPEASRPAAPARTQGKIAARQAASGIAAEVAADVEALHGLTLEAKREIKKALAAIQGVEEVQRDGAKGTVKFTVVTPMGAEEFVEKLVEVTFEGFELEIEDQKMKTIICTCK